MIKWLKSLFYVPKYGKMSEKAFLSRMTSSMLGILICMTAIALTAYAYFSSTITSATQTIRAASYDCVITIDGAVLENDRIELAAGEHIFEIVKHPDATASTGFCVIEVGGHVLHTQQIEDTGISAQEDGTENSDVPFVFVLELDETRQITVTARWGTSSYYPEYVQGVNSDYYILHNERVSVASLNAASDKDDSAQEGAETTQPTAPATEETQVYTEPTLPAGEVYIVQTGDTLYAIAEKYHTTVDALILYNDLEDANLIRVGQSIVIPPQGYVPNGDNAGL